MSTRIPAAARTCALAVVSACAAAEPAGATLDTIIVSAERGGAALKETAAAVARTDAATLARLKPTFIGEALNQTPGVLMPNLGGEQHNLSIRQPMTYNAYYQFLEDGVPIRPVGIFNHNALYEVNLPGADSIEVVRGPASSLFGANAVGGAVNFNTRAPRAGFGGELALRGDEHGYARADVSLEGGRDDLAARFAGYSARGRPDWQQYADYDKEGGTLRVDKWLGDTLWKTTLTASHLYTDMAGSLTPSRFGTDPGYSLHTFTYRDVDALRASTQLSGSLNDGGTSTATLYLRRNHTEQLPSYLIFNTGPTTASGRTTDNRFTSYGLDARHEQALAGWRLVGGVTVERSPNRQTEYNLAVTRDAASQRYTGYTRLGLRRDYEVVLDNGAVYGEAHWQPASAWRLSAGARYDRIGYDYDNRLEPTASTGAPSQQKTFSALSPRLGLTWQASDTVNLYASASRAFTPPEVSALFSSLQAPDLKESAFDNLEAGVRAEPLPGLALQATVYRLTGHDEIVSFSTQPGRSEPRNAGKTRHVGVEFGAGWQAARWDARLAGAYARHRFIAYEAAPGMHYDGRDMPAAPEWIANAELGWKPMQALRVALEAQYVGPYWMNNANTERYAGHTLLHLRANWRRGAWEAWASLTNLADKRYAEIAASTYNGLAGRDPEAQDTYSAGAPRTLLAGVRYRFGGDGQ
ncbi:TonB-dependent receptor [Chitiniphilus purpureus]|uniref:TonB-dependent receptor n=1 Tax=Chitiniphilus purpureus TaxID=2981137 RepID=A0ABY6DU33_9NEIS|nr:TonB-dependent receptor [Chitiniphilus sp. CD1]UXY15373.1 TonB-dependent receptor [Chitiniphilus sp. CD1]